MENCQKDTFAAYYFTINFTIGIGKRNVILNESIREWFEWLDWECGLHATKICYVTSTTKLEKKDFPCPCDIKQQLSHVKCYIMPG